MPKGFPTERFTLSYRPGGGRWKVIGRFATYGEAVRACNMRGDFWIREKTDGDVQELRGGNLVEEAPGQPADGAD